MDTILLVEDDRLLRQLLRSTLEKDSFLILESMNRRRSIEILKQHPISLIVLDLGLPDGNGPDFIDDIRLYTDAPIIVMSGDHRTSRRIDSLNNGADDYVPKPFDPQELIARIHAHIRRYRGEISSETTRGANLPNAAQIDLYCGPWVLDSNSLQAHHCTTGMACDLTADEYRLLETLAKNSGKPIKRDALCEALREENYIPTPRAIDIKISRIRKKICDEAEQSELIKTIRGVGYMLCGSQKAAQ